MSIDTKQSNEVENKENLDTGPIVLRAEDADLDSDGYKAWVASKVHSGSKPEELWSHL